MPNVLDDLIAERKRNGEFYAPPSPAAMEAALQTAPIVARDTDTEERNARMAREATEWLPNGTVIPGPDNPNRRRSRDEWRQIALDNEERDRQFAQQHTLHQEAFAEHQAAIANDLNARQAALQQSEGLLNMAARKHELNTSIQTNIEAADFLHRAGDIPVDAPDHDAQLAALAAELPHAGNNQLVQNFLGTRHTVRQNQYQAQQVLGEEKRKLGYTKDAQVLAAKEQGLLGDDELTFKPDGTNYLHNDDGTINNDAALAVAADRASRGEGTKAAKAAYSDNLNTFKALQARKAASDLDENEQEIYNEVSRNLAGMIKARKAGTAPQGTVVGVPASAGTGSAKSLLGGL